jgi:hypothetical protein
MCSRPGSVTSELAVHRLQLEKVGLVYDPKGRSLSDKRIYWSVFHKSALYQGTTSVVPKRTGKTRGFNP